MNNGVPTDLVALFVGMGIGVVLGWVFRRASAPRSQQARKTPAWDWSRTPLARRMRGGADLDLECN